MSLEPGSRQGNASPLSSGRSSPIPHRRKNTYDDTLIKKDPKNYKKFAVGVDRALQLFENTLQEWADYISFLGRLLKALQAYPAIPVVPSKTIVAKRLAQCMNPRLPSGVHQKTIEVYSYIFSLIGHDGLVHDLQIWTPGLVPVLSYASISVKPHLLSLFETFYIPLARELRPALKSLILAILPGIDEEGSEHFDRTFALLESISNGINEETYFWQCLLLSVVASPGKRQGALAFFQRKLPNLSGDDSISSPLVSPEPGLLLRCFSAGLLDEQLLVQRGFLDFLVQNLPLSSPILQKLVARRDLDKLLVDATNVVLRRDMSLNRRLWVWLLGPQPEVSSPSSTADYFQVYGLESLVRGIKGMLDLKKADPTSRARPYRILLSLMDRWEIGGSVVPMLFVDAVRSVSEYEKSASSKDYTEVLRSASTFFDGVEPGLIWAEILEILLGAFNTALSSDEAKERLELGAYVLRTFNVREEEMVIIYAPLVLLAFIVKIGQQDFGEKQDILTAAWNVAMIMLDIIPDRAFTSTMIQDSLSIGVESTEALHAISQFFSRDAKRKNSFPPMSTKLCGGILLEQISVSISSKFNTTTDSVSSCCKLLAEAVKKVPRTEQWQTQDLVMEMCVLITNTDFSVLLQCTNVVAALHIQDYLTTTDLDLLVLPIVEQHWEHLSPDVPKHHVETCQALWNLQHALADRRLEAAISTVMTGTSVSGVKSRARPGRHFTVLWNHSSNVIEYEQMLVRPLLLVLDSFSEESAELHVYIRGWLQNLASTERIFDTIISKLLSFSTRSQPSAILKHAQSTDDDLDLCLYYMQIVANILRYSTDSILASLAGESIPLDAERKALLKSHGFIEEDVTYQVFFAQYALNTINGDASNDHDQDLVLTVSRLHRTALSILHQLLLSPYAQSLAEMALEVSLIVRLKASLRDRDTYIQVAILDVLFAALKLSMFRQASDMAQMVQRRPSARDTKTQLKVLTVPEERETPPQPTPPAELVQVLIDGFSSTSSRSVLDNWINFLTECLPLLSPVIFQILLPLVECFCLQLRQTFGALKLSFQEPQSLVSPEMTLVALLNGLEHLLAAAHDQLLASEAIAAGPKSAVHEPAGFFGHMVSGVFSGEAAQARSASANNRLTVLLCFQDTVRICYSLWSWGEASIPVSLSYAASLDYTSFRMRSRARRILEHLFQAETLECLETLIGLWMGKEPVPRSVSVYKLVHVLDNSRPKHTISAIFNAILSRTNPSVLEPSRKSSLTSELSDSDVAAFLVDYSRSLEDDAMEEIWPDCLAFLTEVLKSPFPHRQTLPSLVQFAAILGEKVDNTNFGEQKKMRKDLGDTFLRLLSSAFTVRPVTLASENEKNDEVRRNTDEIINILRDIVPRLRKVLIEQDRILSALTTIVTSVVTPAFKSKSFPVHLPASLLDLVSEITHVPNAQKAWKKDIGDAFSDNKLFNTPANVVGRYWIPLLRQLILSEKERITELFARLSPPTTAGVLFGVGAASARSEADKKTQLTLRRIALLIFAAEVDHFVVNMTELEEKVVELLSATTVTSPSSAIRAEIFLLLRVLIIRTSPVHLASFWPLINAELQSVLSSLFPDGGDGDRNTDLSVIEACKLLDLLLVAAPEVFQLHEWLFITDNIEAVYRPSSSLDYSPSALADQVSNELGLLQHSTSGRRNSEGERDMSAVVNLARGNATDGGEGKRQLLLRERDATLLGKDDVVKKVIRPFLSYLSIWAFENTYAMEIVDMGMCEELVLGDLFDEPVMLGGLENIVRTDLG